MNDRITVGAGALMTSLAGAAAVARAWPTASPAKHRTPWKLSLADLLGRPSAYTTPDIPDLAIVGQRLAECPRCVQVTAGAVTRDGTWRCGECTTHVLVGGS
jgi:hypothetical protein